VPQSGTFKNISGFSAMKDLYRLLDILAAFGNRH
jgi:hypothetical protein